MANSKDIDWSLFTNQEKEISTINNELYNLRKQKYPEYRDSYYRYYNEFGMRGMIGDLYRKFDRLKIMSESYTGEDIEDKEKEITDQFYDIISYCQLQLYWLRREKWGDNVKNSHAHTFSWSNTTSVGPSYWVSPELIDRGAKIIDEALKFTPIGGSTVTITVRALGDLKNIDENKLCELIRDKIRESFGR